MAGPIAIKKMNNRSICREPAAQTRRRLTPSCVVCLIVSGGLTTMTGCSGAGASSDSPPGISEYVQGVQADDTGDRARAMTEFRQAIASNPSLCMAHIRLADLYRNEGDYSNAAEQYAIAASLDPYSASNHYNLGLSYQLLHRLADAAAAYLRALHLDPFNMRANMNLGLVYLELGHPDDALSYLRRSTQLDPNSAQAWSNYGVGLDGTGRLREAEQAYVRALELDSGSPTTLENLASNLIAQRKASAALAVCQQLLLRSDTALTRTRYGQALALAGENDLAMKQFNLALKRNAHSYLTMTAEAFLLIDEYRAGMQLDEPKRQTALALWDESLHLNPDQPDVVSAMARWKSSQLYGN
jgi:tetratricopeptide (TPR) repeat protein